MDFQPRVDLALLLHHMQPFASVVSLGVECARSVWTFPRRVETSNWEIGLKAGFEYASASLPHLHPCHAQSESRMGEVRVADTLGRLRLACNGVVVDPTDASPYLGL